MANTLQPKKPKTVLHAEWALGAWTVWFCSLGLYRSWTSLPGLQNLMTEQFQGMVIIDFKMIMTILLILYALVAFSLLCLILKIGQGKSWARTSLLLNFTLQFLMTVWPPYKGIMNYLPTLPDLILQVYVLYLLYTWPGRAWFTRDKWASDLMTS